MNMDRNIQKLHVTLNGCVHPGEYLARYEVGGLKAAMKSIVAAGGTVVQHIEGVRVLVVRSGVKKFGTLLDSDASIMHIEVCHCRRYLQYKESTRSGCN